MRVNKPMVELDCCYKIEKADAPGFPLEVLQSTTIANTKRNPNFYDSVDLFDVWMPEKEKYLPPMMIKVLDCRAFGRKVCVCICCNPVVSWGGRIAQTEKFKKRCVWGWLGVSVDR